MLLVGVAALAGCANLAGRVGAPAAETAAAPAPRFTYVPPLQSPGEGVALAVEGSPEAVRQRLIARAAQPPFQPGPTDPSGTFVIATFSGDPERFVNCGYLIGYVQGAASPPQAYPAARANLTVPRGEGATAERQLQLDARITVRLTPEAGITLISTEALYVISKPVDTLGGTPRPAETVSFASDRRGTLADGTVCQPNGMLEREILRDLLPGPTGPAAV
jgi:hypothetical protein